MKDLKDFINECRNVTSYQDYIRQTRNLWVCEHTVDADYDEFIENNNLICSIDNYKLYEELSFKWRGYGMDIPEGYEAFQCAHSVNETLLYSWDSNVLIDKLSKIFDMKDVKKLNPSQKTTQFEFYVDGIISIEELDNDDKYRKFWNVMHLYNYYLRLLKHDNDKTYFTIEPYKPNIVNKFIYDDCHGIVYHVTSRKAWDKIKNSEIKPSTINCMYRDGTYEYRDGRSFFIASNDKKEVIHELRSLVHLKHIDDPIYIKVDLNKHTQHPNIKFRLDSSGTGYKVFTEEPIPCYCCEEIELKEIK